MEKVMSESDRDEFLKLFSDEVDFEAILKTMGKPRNSAFICRNIDYYLKNDF